MNERSRYTHPHPTAEARNQTHWLLKKTKKNNFRPRSPTVVRLLRNLCVFLFQVRPISRQRADVPARGGAGERRGGDRGHHAAEPACVGVPGGFQLPLHHAGGPVPQHRQGQEHCVSAVHHPRDQVRLARAAYICV